MDFYEEIYEALKNHRKAVAGDFLREKQLFLFKYADKEDDIEVDLNLLNSELKDVLSSNYDLFSELVSLRKLREEDRGNTSDLSKYISSEPEDTISEEEYKELAWKLLSDKSDYFDKLYELIKGGNDSVQKFYDEVPAKILDLVSPKGEVGRVYTFLNRLKNSPKIQDVLKKRMAEFYQLWKSGNYREILERFSKENIRLYAIWNRLTDSQKDIIAEKSKDILKKMILGLDESDSTIGNIFEDSLDSTVKDPAWKSFFKSLFFTGLFEPFLSLFKSSSKIGRFGSVIDKNNFYYGRIGRVKKIGKISILIINGEEIHIPFEDIRFF